MKENLRQKLTGLGVSNAAIVILEEEEIESEEALRTVVATGTSIPGIKAGSMAALRANFGSAQTATPSQIVVKLDRGPKPINEMTEAEDLLDVLASDRGSADKKAAARRLATEFGRRVVVEKDKKTLRLDDTKNYWRRGDPRSSFWGRENFPVVAVQTLFATPDERVEIDPLELAKSRRLVALDDGFNPDTTADWSGVSMRRRALLVDAFIKNEVVARGDAMDIVEALSKPELSRRWKVLEDRADQERLAEIERCLTAPLSTIETPDSDDCGIIMVLLFGAENRPSTPPSGRSGNAEQELVKLLLSLFSKDGLRRHVRYGERGEEIELSVSYGASAMDYACEIVDALKNRGLLGPVFFARLEEERPKRSTEIRELSARFSARVH